MDKNQKPAANETTEIDDKTLDQVVGGVTAEDTWSTNLKTTTTIKTGTSSFGGDEWDKR
jgi:hypothetical protein